MSLFNNNAGGGGQQGLFANKPQGGGGNLFGNNNTAQTGQQGGLFANNNAQTGQQGGIFANNTPQTGGAQGAIFQNQNQNQGQAPAAGQNLFNNNQNKPQNTGAPLFGGAQQTNPPANNQGGLFGGQTNTNTAVNTAAPIIGGQTTNPVQQGGIFGNKPANPLAPTTAQPTTLGATNPQVNTTTTAQTNPQTQLNNTASDVSLANEKLNPLVQKWKRKIQNQSENLLQTYTQLGESITQIEQCYNYYDKIASISQGLNGQFEQINIEVKNIEQYQVQIESHLDIIRQKLTKQLELQGDSEANAFKNPIGEKIQGIDFGLCQIEKNVNQLIDEINPQKDQSQDGKNTIQQCLNSYYQILEKLEYDTINLQFKLQSVAEKVSEQQ